MAWYLANYGPFTFAVDATSWETYTGGVMIGCVSQQVDHTATMVGYNFSANPRYWLVKNQWGSWWGENGYIRLEYGTNQCLLTSTPSAALVAGNTMPTFPPTRPTQAPTTTPPLTTTAPPGIIKTICSDPQCAQGCNSISLPTEVCLTSADGLNSVIYSCAMPGPAGAIAAQVFENNVCNGSGPTLTYQTSSCYATDDGNYFSFAACWGEAHEHAHMVDGRP